MARRLTIIVVLVVIAVAILAAVVWTLPQPRAPDGPFGFPQADAVVLCDDEDLRVSVVNDAQHLFVQAIVWRDRDQTLGESTDGRAIGDRAYLDIDADADAAITTNVDRRYWLDVLPTRLGLSYQVHQGGGSMTHLRGDSKGRGAIRYVDTGGGAVARVDSFLVPLAEIGRAPGDDLSLVYWGRSEHPDLILNSLGVPYTDPYGIRPLPRERYHSITLAGQQPPLDAAQVPSGRADAAATAEPARPLPGVGTTPPELSAADWINADEPPTLAGLRGSVVLIDFWTTVCTDCVELVPHLNDLHERYAPRGLRVVAFTAQSRRGIKAFLEHRQMAVGYTIGTGSDLEKAYGIPKLPYAVLVGRRGRVLWHGRPTPDLERLIVAALGPG
jgi:thiol-disulfide isomerase/thioredoxin